MVGNIKFWGVYEAIIYSSIMFLNLMLAMSRLIVFIKLYILSNIGAGQENWERMANKVKWGQSLSLLVPYFCVKLIINISLAFQVCRVQIIKNQWFRQVSWGVLERKRKWRISKEKKKKNIIFIRQKWLKHKFLMIMIKLTSHLNSAFLVPK